MGFINLIVFAVKTYAQGVISFIFEPVAWAFLFVLYSQYKKIYQLQREVYYGESKLSVKDMVVTSILAGLIAGIVGNVFMTAVGITFSRSLGLEIVVLISLVLLIINPRYVCLSYSGGLYSIFLIISDYLIKKGIITSESFINAFEYIRIDVPSLLAIVGVMHLIESVLVWFDGHRSAIPAFIKKDDEIQGIYLIQRFWPIPLIFFFLMMQNVPAGDLVATPDWWPLVKPTLVQIDVKNSVFMAIPVFAMMGYGDFAVTTNVERKVKRTSLHLAVFSITLIILSLLATKYPIFTILAALFSPIAHEGLILYERSKEKKGKPIWVRREDGVIVLDSMPNSPAGKMGIQPGDLIVSINNRPIKGLDDVISIFDDYVNFIWVEVLDIDGNRKIYEYKDYQNGVNELGVLTIPKYSYNVPILEDRKGLFDKLKKRRKK
ncbi:Cell division topological determinant MinJ [Caloramator mitchellensis]|uniref:Cell division topological determinant MinJ n=1 Tax=Caloramator mitchellensis TaxID=908809 RepID=A0A0R3K458_CALMK|nr:PDZ domain-containing protein [Caloramator mitchellensis]KRQ87119.1 Cell division topological determinant MinJ [Caloramator mitchellensis]